MTRTIVGLALLTVGLLVAPAGAQRPARAPEASSPALSPIRLKPAGLVYRQVEGTPLKGPRGVFVDQARGEVYVADTMNDIVAIYDRDGLPLFAFGYNGELDEPVKAVVDGRGRIYVLSGVARNIKVFSYRGEYIHHFPFHGVEGSPVPTALGADIEGGIYIADATSGQILVYDADQRLRLRFGNERAKDGRFRAVQAITVDRDGRIYVVEAQGTAVRIFDADGKFVRGWGEHGAGPNNFSLPNGVALDAAGRVIVVDGIRQVLSLFTTEGRYLARYGGYGNAPGALAFPADVASDGDKRLYVVERVGSRLQIFDEEPLARGVPARGRGIAPTVREEIKRSLGEIVGGQR